MQQQLMFTKDETAIWTWMVSKGIANSLSGLSEMVGHELNVTSLNNILYCFSIWPLNKRGFYYIRGSNLESTY